LLLKGHLLELIDELRRQLSSVQLVLLFFASYPLWVKQVPYESPCDSSQVLRPTRWALVLA
jgi:hypothetical protein